MKSRTDLKYSPSPMPPKRKPTSAATAGLRFLRGGGSHEGGLKVTSMPIDPYFRVERLTGRRLEKVGDPVGDRVSGVGDKTIVGVGWAPVAGIAQVRRRRYLANAGVRGEAVSPGVHVRGTHR